MVVFAILFYLDTEADIPADEDADIPLAGLWEYIDRSIND